MCSESKFYIHLMITVLFWTFKQGCQPGFLKNQICRTGCGHSRKRGGGVRALFPRPGRPQKCPILEAWDVGQFPRPQGPRPASPGAGALLYKLFAHGRGGTGTLASWVWALWSPGRRPAWACPAPSRRTADPVFFKLCFFDFCSFIFRASLVCF